MSDPVAVRGAPPIESALALGEGLSGEFTLAVTQPVAEPNVEALLRLTRLRSLVLNAPPATLLAKHRQRVGEYWPERNAWQLPAECARTLVLATRRERVGLPMMASAWSRGVRIMYWWTPSGWAGSALWHLLLAQSARRIRERIQDRVLWPALDVIQRAFGQRAGLRQRQCERPLALNRYLEDLTAGRAPRALIEGRPAPILSTTAFDPERIVLINGSLGPGGAERQLANTLVGLYGRGIRSAELWCRRIRSSQDSFYVPMLHAAGIGAREIEPADLRNLELSASQRLKVQRVSVHLPAALQEYCVDLLAELLRHRPAVLHAWQDEPSLAAGLAGIAAGVPRIILSARNVAPPSFAYHLRCMRPVYRALATRQEVVLTNNSEAGLKDYSRWLDLPESRFVLLRNGIDTAAFGALSTPPDAAARDLRERLGIPLDVPLISGVLRLSPEKRPLLWAEVAAALSRTWPEAHFLLIGEGPERECLLERVQALGLEERLHLPGTMTDVRPALAAAQVFLLTSSFEGAPNVTLEAQLFGVPVVATEAGGCAETFDASRTGWCPESDDPEAIAERVDWVLRNHQWRAQVAERGPAFIDQNFGMARMLDETLALYGLDHRMNAVARPSCGGPSMLSG
ncbi:MAG: glycosyltransferase [Gammaproteobacteria bacterium]|nr:glycosyltransferase [Gammaproteobacteria bacterium]